MWRRVVNRRGSLVSDRAGRYLLTAALVLSLSAVTLPAEFKSTITPMDEGALLVYPERVLHGAVPNRDFQTLYGPADPWLLAVAYQIFGVDIDVERMVGLLARVAIIAALLVLVSEAGTLVTALTGVVAWALLTTLGLVTYAWWPALAAVLWSVVALRQQRLFLAGGLIGVALLFRPDLIIVALCSAAIIRDRRYVFGLATGIAPYLIHVALAGPSAVVQGLVVDPFLQSPGRRLPIPVTTGAFWAVVVSIILLVFACRLEWKRSHERWVLVLAATAVLLTGQAWQRADLAHLVMGAVTGVALLPWAVSALLPPLSKISVACLVTSATVLSVGPFLGTAKLLILEEGPYPGENVRYEGRSLPIDQGEAGDLSALLEEVGAISQPGDRLFVGPSDLARAVYNDTFLYYYFPSLIPATYYLEMNPGLPNRAGSRLPSDIASADIVILTHWYDGFQEPNSSAYPGPIDPSSALARFCLRETFGPWDLLTPCSDTSAAGN